MIISLKDINQFIIVMEEQCESVRQDLCFKYYLNELHA